ncbi:hypothetical protein ACVTW2_000656 [Escherichia coli]
MRSEIRENDGRYALDDDKYVGVRSGRLEITKVFRKTNNRGRSVRHVACVCDCGNLCSPTLYCVLKGNTKSCGCLHKEIMPTLFESSPQLNKETYKGYDRKKGYKAK